MLTWPQMRTLGRALRELGYTPANARAVISMYHYSDLRGLRELDLPADWTKVETLAS